MRLPWQKQEQPYVFTWESEPYKFERGAIYVIEIDRKQIELKQVMLLGEFFDKQGVIVNFVFTDSGKALNPIKVKRKKEAA